MVKILLISDNQDPDMGPYFARCATHAKTAFHKTKIEIYEILSDNLNPAFVDVTVDKFNGDRFLCLVYSHGSRTSFASKEPFIVKGATQKFSKSFFYTFSCHTGTEVGVDLIESGCISFWGYTSKAGYVIGYIDLFVECANFGIIKMVEGMTSGEAFELMKANYDVQTYSIYRSNFVVASMLMSNKMVMVLHGRKDTKFEEFVII